MQRNTAIISMLSLIGLGLLAAMNASPATKDAAACHPRRGALKSENVRGHRCEPWHQCGDCSGAPLATKPRSGPRQEQPWINPRDGAEFVWVPAGGFVMGGEAREDQRPVHTVNLPGYWIGRTPVTVAQYRAFCNATQRRMPTRPVWGWQDTHPIVGVSWYDAVAYCQWAGVRLPTEAEWEKAARGTDGRTYPWGNDWDTQKCVTLEGGHRGTAPVGSRPAGASPYGCLDMAGNVWEWTSSRFQPYPYRADDGREEWGGAGPRVLHGGCWGSSAEFARVFSRLRGGPDAGNTVNIGFRCARSAD